MTSNYRPKIELRVGDTVEFADEEYRITGRVDGPEGADTFVVEHTTVTPSEELVRHMDWFAQQAAEAEHVGIDR